MFLYCLSGLFKGHGTKKLNWECCSSQQRKHQSGTMRCKHWTIKVSWWILINKTHNWIEVMGKGTKCDSWSLWNRNFPFVSMSDIEKQTRYAEVACLRIDPMKLSTKLFLWFNTGVASLLPAILGISGILVLIVNY
jgi:hypothetical protein